MQLSWRQILAPWAGALAGFFASRGLNLSPDQLIALVVICAGAAGNLLHFLEAWLSPKGAPAPVLTVITQQDPAKQPAAAAPTSSSSSTLKLLLPFLVLLTAIPWLHACSTLGAAAPQSTDESIAYGYGLYTAVESALSESLAAGQVSKATAIAVDAKAGNARALLDAARAAELVNPAGAASNLATATQLLEALQVFLNHPTGAVP